MECRTRWLGFSNVIQSFTQGRPRSSWAQELAFQVQSQQSAVRKRCARVVKPFEQPECAALQPPTPIRVYTRPSSRIIQARCSSTIWSSTSSRTSSSRDVAQSAQWDRSGDDLSIHSSAHHLQIPQIQTPALIHYIFRPDPPLGPYLPSFSGAAPTFPRFPFLVVGRLNLTIYMRVWVYFHAKSIARCSQPASLPSRQVHACSSFTPTIDRISPSTTWHSSIWPGVWKCGKMLTERFPVRFLGCSEISSLCTTSMFRLRHCLTHVSGGPGRGGCALDRARVEAHKSVRPWACIFRFY